MTPAARIQAAIDILNGLDASQMPADRFIREFFRARRYAGSKDRASVTERVYDVFRHRGEFAWRMASETNRALVIGSLLAEGLDAPVIQALFSGDGYGPGILSDGEQAAVSFPKKGDMPAHVRGEFPEFLTGELKRRFVGEVSLEMAAMAGRAPVDLRVNTLKAEKFELFSALMQEGFEPEFCNYAPNGLRLGIGKNTSSLQQSKSFLAGAFEFQDEAAQICAMICDVKPGMRVLDLAAGAGGKSLALAAAMENRGEVVACDVRSGALDQLRERAKRAGVEVITSKLISRLHDGDLFDLVLLDAPCSGTGTWRRQPELRWRTTPERIDELNALQDKLLAQAASHVKPSGRLVYATCSVLPRENEDRVSAFLAKYPSFKPLEADRAFVSAGGRNIPPGLTDYFRASPRVTGTDGFYAAVMHKLG